VSILGYELVSSGAGSLEYRFRRAAHICVSGNARPWRGEIEHGTITDCPILFFRMTALSPGTTIS
jgi:hypothetical protein